MILPECPVCLSNNNESFINVLNPPCEYLLCGCGAAFLYPRMSDEELINWYKSGQYRQKTSRGDDKNTNAHRQHQERARYITGILGNSRIKSHLDIGCSSGELLKDIGRKYPGIIQVGVDPDTVLQTNEFDIYESIQDVPGEFTLITMIQTLEHINNPVEMVNCVYDRLSPNGIFMCEVPNRRATMIAYLAPQHVIAYDEDSLKLLMKRFKTIKTIKHGMPYESPLDLSILMILTK